MALYDGNQLPESPTSTFQLVVSILYVLFVCMLFALGGIATFAAQQQVDSEVPAHVYMKKLLNQHNAVARGLLAFVPAVYCLTHLFTSTLHNGTLYSASNVVSLALFAFGAKYLGSAIVDLRQKGLHMDMFKAVYECLYMLNMSYAKLGEHNRDKKDSIFYKMEDGQHKGEGKRSGGGDYQNQNVWRHPGTLFDVFLAVGSQDDSRLWIMLTSWIRRWWFGLSLLSSNMPPNDYVWNTWPFRYLLQPFASLLRACHITQWQRRRECMAYGYWLYHKSNRIRSYTGSLAANHDLLIDKLNRASFNRYSSQMFLVASTYFETLSAHFKKGLKVYIVPDTVQGDLTIIGATGNCYKLSELANCLCNIRYGDQRGLAMACERYICRLTPACAATCLPVNSVVGAFTVCYEALFGDAGLGHLQELLKSDPGKYCVWFKL